MPRQLLTPRFPLHIIHVDVLHEPLDRMLCSRPQGSIWGLGLLLSEEANSSCQLLTIAQHSSDSDGSSSPCSGSSKNQPPLQCLPIPSLPSGTSPGRARDRETTDPARGCFFDREWDHGFCWLQSQQLVLIVIFTCDIPNSQLSFHDKMDLSTIDPEQNPTLV